MSALQDSEGLQVDPDRQKPPEVATQYPYDPNFSHAPEVQKQQRPPFGLGIWVFAALVAVVTALVVGGAVGGGLGAALANSQKSNCPAAPASTTQSSADDTGSSCNETTTAQDGTTLYTPKPPDQVKNLTLECPEAGRKELDGPSGYKFDMWCGVDAATGTPSRDGGEIKDIAAIIAYTIEDCISACVQLRNLNETQQSVRSCESLVFGATLQDYMISHGGNCFLKDGKKAAGGNWRENEQTLFAYAEVKDSS